MRCREPNRNFDDRGRQHWLATDAGNTQSFVHGSNAESDLITKPHLRIPGWHCRIQNNAIGITSLRLRSCAMTGVNTFESCGIAITVNGLPTFSSDCESILSGLPEAGRITPAFTCRGTEPSVAFQFSQVSTPETGRKARSILSTGYSSSR